MEAKKVFYHKVCPMMTAKTKDDFKKARKRLNDKHWRYTKTSKATFPELSVDMAFVPDPRKYRGSHVFLRSDKSLQRKGSFSSSITWKLSALGAHEHVESFHVMLELKDSFFAMICLSVGRRCPGEPRYLRGSGTNAISTLSSGKVALDILV